MNLKKIILITLGVGILLLLATGILRCTILGAVDPELGVENIDPKTLEKLIKEQILEDLQTSGEKLFISSPIQLERSSKVIRWMGILNIESTEKLFGINIEYVKKQKPDGSTVAAPEGADEISFFYSDVVDKQLSPTEGDVIPLSISAKSSAAGNYVYKVNVLAETIPGACAQGLETPGCELYDTQMFFVEVS